MAFDPTFTMHPFIMPQSMNPSQRFNESHEQVLQQSGLETATRPYRFRFKTIMSSGCSPDASYTSRTGHTNNAYKYERVSRLFPRCCRHRQHSLLSHPSSRDHKLAGRSMHSHTWRRRRRWRVRVPLPLKGRGAMAANKYSLEEVRAGVAKERAAAATSSWGTRRSGSCATRPGCRRRCACAASRRWWC